MKRYYYNNWLAQVLLHFSTCHTIAIGWFVLSKLSEEQTSQKSRNHETIHAMQWTEVTMASGTILLAIVLLFGISAWWMLLAPLMYYIWYLFEWFIKLPHGNAYHYVSFEMEAYCYDEDNDYCESRKMFTEWVSRI